MTFDEKARLTRQMADREKELEFERLVASNRGVITKVCYMYATDSEHFKDLWQETLINLWKALESFRGESSVTTWIYRITINTCISCFRSGSKHRGNLSLNAESMMELADRATDDEEHAACLREMYRLINRLPALDKALVLMWLDEKSYQEIAEVTGLSRSNVATRLNRCRQKLTRMSNE